jgi:hypothetical protein
MFAPDGSHGRLVKGALRAMPSPERSADRAAEHLHEFMAGEDPSSVKEPDERWARIVDNALPLVDVSGLERPTCTDRLVERPGYPGPAAALRSEFPVPDGVPFKNAVKILAPENWPRCMKTFWRCMKKDNVVPNRYHEEVSTNPDDPANALFTARAVLDFVFDDDDEDQWAITTYDLAPDQPRDGLDVDRGSLVVHRLPGGGLHVTTTKRLRLKGPVNGEGLSIVACLFGWTGQGKRMMNKCSELPEHELWHVARLDDRGPRRSTTGAGSQRGTTREGMASASIAQQAAATIKDYVDFQAAYMQEWADRVAGGDYGYGEMADEMVRAGVRMATDSARIMNVAVKNAQRGAAGARARRPARADEPDDEEERHH